MGTNRHCPAPPGSATGIADRSGAYQPDFNNTGFSPGLLVEATP